MSRGRTNSERAVFAEGFRVRGHVRGDVALEHHGFIEGDVALEGDLSVAKSGTIQGTVRAAEVQVVGTVRGDIHATGAVHIQAGATVSGTVKGKEIALDEGASFDGRIEADFELPAELGGSGRRKG